MSLRLQKDCSELSVSRSCTLGLALERLNRTAKRIIVVEEKNKFIGVCNDGDLRRGLLKGLTLESEIESCIQRNPVVAVPGVSTQRIKSLILEGNLSAIPFVQNEKLLGIYFLGEEASSLDVPLVIMAGGKGTRMRPYTLNTPKAMLKVAGKPMLQHIIEDASNQGIKDVVISVGFLSDKIQKYFGEGDSFGLKIRYITEDKPMGTFGSLTQFTDPTQALGAQFFLRNGDVLARCSYSNLLEQKLQKNCDFMITGRNHVIENPYGVIASKRGTLVGIEEKPRYHSQINAGIYLFNSDDLKYVKEAGRLDVTEYVSLLIEQKKVGGVYSMRGAWMDVGRPADLDYAQVEFSEGLIDD